MNKMTDVLKHPTTGTAGIMSVVIVAVTMNPAMLPYAAQAHEHDITAMQNVIIKTVGDSVQKTTLRSDIKRETEQIQRLDAQILSKLCIVAEPPCQLEITFKQQALNRRASYQRELNSLP